MTDSRRDRLTWESGLKEEISERPRREREKPDPPALPAWLTWITDDRLIVRPTLNEEISDRPRGKREKPDPSALPAWLIWMIGLPSERPGEKREKVPLPLPVWLTWRTGSTGCTLPRTQYCSPDCWKQDWKNHKKACAAHSATGQRARLKEER